MGERQLCKLDVVGSIPSASTTYGDYMVAKNDITGDSIQTKGVSDAYRNNYDLIFGKKKVDNTDVTKDQFQDVLSTEECLDGKAET